MKICDKCGREIHLPLGIDNPIAVPEIPSSRDSGWYSYRDLCIDCLVEFSDLVWKWLKEKPEKKIAENFSEAGR